MASSLRGDGPAPGAPASVCCSCSAVVPAWLLRRPPGRRTWMSLAIPLPSLTPSTVRSAFHFSASDQSRRRRDGDTDRSFLDLLAGRRHDHASAPTPGRRRPSRSCHGAGLGITPAGPMPPCRRARGMRSELHSMQVTAVPLAISRRHLGSSGGEGWAESAPRPHQGRHDASLPLLPQAAALLARRRSPAPMGTSAGHRRPALQPGSEQRLSNLPDD